MPADCQLRSMGNCNGTVEYPRFKAVYQSCTYLCVGVDDVKTAATARTIAKETCMNIMCEDSRKTGGFYVLKYCSLTFF
jgi:hypothetical protein